MKELKRDFQLRFYANSKHYENKLFSFYVGTPLDAYALLLRFVARGNYIKVAYLQPFMRENMKMRREMLTKINNFDLSFLESHFC